MSEAAAISNGPLSQRVQQLVDVMRNNLVKAMKEGVQEADWAPLRDLIAVEEFERVGPFRDALDWQGYVQLLCQWLNHSEGWDPVMKLRVEADGVVFMQCEEMITNGDRVDPFYSLSIYRFNDQGKIKRLEVYMQQPQQPA